MRKREIDKNLFFHFEQFLTDNFYKFRNPFSVSLNILNKLLYELNNLLSQRKKIVNVLRTVDTFSDTAIVLSKFPLSINCSSFNAFKQTFFSGFNLTSNDFPKKICQISIALIRVLQLYLRHRYRSYCQNFYPP